MIELTADMVKRVAEGIREYNADKPPVELINNGEGELVSVLPQEYHDNAWFRAVEYGLRKIFND